MQSPERDGRPQREFESGTPMSATGRHERECSLLSAMGGPSANFDLVVQ
jgi:hypothetical protein